MHPPPPPRSLAGWVEQNDRDTALYPLNGGYWTDFPCLSWGGNVVDRPPLETVQAAGEILFLQTERDPITSLEGALASLDALPNASMIEVIGDDFNHGVIVPYGDACIDGPVSSYFLQGRQPPRRIECRGRALPPPGAASAVGTDTGARSAITAASRQPPVTGRHR